MTSGVQQQVLFVPGAFSKGTGARRQPLLHQEHGHGAEIVKLTPSGPSGQSG